MSRMIKMRDQMKLLNSNSGFDNCINIPSFNTKLSALHMESFSLDRHCRISFNHYHLIWKLSDIEKFDFVDLPLRFFVPESDMIPTDWSLDDLERE